MGRTHRHTAVKTQPTANGRRFARCKNTKFPETRVSEIIVNFTWVTFVLCPRAGFSSCLNLTLHQQQADVVRSVIRFLNMRAVNWCRPFRRRRERNLLNPLTQFVSSFLAHLSTLRYYYCYHNHRENMDVTL